MWMCWTNPYGWIVCNFSTIAPKSFWTIANYWFFFNLNKAYNYKYFVLFFSLYLISIYISSSRTPFFLTIFFVFLIIFFVKNFRNILLKSLSILLIFLICEAFFEFGKTRVFHRVFKITFIQLTDHYYHPRDELPEITSKKKKQR